MLRVLAVFLVVAASTALGYGPGARAEETQMSEVKVGDTPGAFALNDHEGKTVRLGDGKGHGWFVLAFFPKAMTGG
jgi:cytochrome oxidase Cu insertion factor (SCO1/SenC/PrrC family)